MWDFLSKIQQAGWLTIEEYASLSIAKTAAANREKIQFGNCNTTGVRETGVPDTERGVMFAAL